MYLRDQSEPSQQHYVFAYFVRIENVGHQAAQLMSRRWFIHDSAGEDIEVKGEGAAPLFQQWNKEVPNVMGPK